MLRSCLYPGLFTRAAGDGKPSGNNTNKPKMPFKPLTTLANKIRGWIQAQSSLVLANSGSRKPKALISTFRRLEKRRVFAVDAFFVGGALDIEITNVGQTNANLLTDGTDFYVDNNNNQTFELGEIRGAIADLQSLHAFSNDSIGKLFWKGDFSAAPLAIPLGASEVVRTEGLSEVHLQASFSANGNVSLHALDTVDFNSNMVVQGNLNVAVSTGGTIVDGADAAVHVLGDAVIQSQNSIHLGDDVTSSWRVDGLTRVASQGDIELGLVGSWDSNTLLATGNNISVVDENAISIAGLQSQGDLSLYALDNISDQPGASLIVGGNANIQGMSIVLADTANDVLNINGAVHFISTGGSVTIASPGSVALGDVSASGANIALFEDADTSLASIQTPGTFSATSTGEIFDIAGANIQATALNLTTAGSIHLADNLTDSVSIVGRAFLSASNRIDLESQGSINFGSLGLLSDVAVVFEDSATQLDGTKLRQLELHSRDQVTQSGVDTGAGSTVLKITGTVYVSLLGTPGSIDLYRASSNPPTTLSDGRLLDNQISGVFSADGIDGDFRLRNASIQATIGALDGSFGDLTIWHTYASIVLPNQDLHVSRDLELIAGVDIHDPVPLVNNPLDRILNNNARIEDSGTKLFVGGNVHFVASANIAIADGLGETLNVTTGKTSIVSLGGGQITIGSAGTALLSELGIYSRSILDGHTGNIVVQVDRSVILVNPTMPFPDMGHLKFTANNAKIIVDGNVTDAPGLQIFLDGDFVVTAIGDIRLADDPLDTIRVGNETGFTSLSGSIELGGNGSVQMNDVSLNADHGDISVGGSGRTELGVIEARGIDVAIHEDTAMVVRTAFALNQLRLSSEMSILNTFAIVPGGLQGISAKGLSIEAGTYAHLGPISVDRLTASVKANGTLDNGGLFVLNAMADETGQRYLDAVGENLPPGVTSVNQLLSGDTLADLRSRASFIHSFGSDYGLFVQNNKELTVGGVIATGDGIHVLIETPRGADLIVEGTVTQRFTQQDSGGVVLIAGDQLRFGASAALRIEHVSLDVSTSRVINQPSLIANAFDGAKGPVGHESTRDVLYASDAFADTGIQNVLQRVSTQVGVDGEAGFQTLIRYADGRSQLFDSNEELNASLQSNPAANTKPGVIPAYASSKGDAAVVERNSPFSDTFLGTFQTLPTSAVFRRSSEFFLFEQGGAVDSSVSRVDLTPVVDRVDNVLSPGRKISFPMPSEIVVNPAILVAPIRVAPSESIAYSNASSDAEPSALGDAKFEVFIVKVGFDDANRDGQASDPELPPRNEVQVDAVVQKNNESDTTLKANESGSTKRPSLAPGEPNLLTKDAKGSRAPTATEIDGWTEEYRDDPNRPSGAYAIISVDSVSGANVLKVFGVRDFEIVDPDQSSDHDSIDGTSIQGVDSKPEEESPK